MEVKPEIITSNRVYSDITNPKSGIMVSADNTYNWIRLSNDGSNPEIHGQLDTGKRAKYNPVSLGNGYFGVGKWIFKYGESKRICKFQKLIHANTDGAFITRFHENGNLVHITINGLNQNYFGDKSNEIVIRIYELDMVNRTARCISKKLIILPADQKIYDYQYSVSNAIYYKDHLIVKTYNFIEGKYLSIYTLINTITAERTDGLSPNSPVVDYNNHINIYLGKKSSTKISFIDNTGSLGLFYGEYYRGTYKEEDDDCEPPVKLHGIIDVEDGKFELKKVEIDDYYPKRLIIEKAFGVRDGNFAASSAYLCADNILQVNRVLYNGMRHVRSMPPNYKPTINDEVLIYVPTCTVLPIVGYKKHKDVTIRSLLRSPDGAYLALAVEATDFAVKRLQICVINTTSGEVDHFMITDITSDDIKSYIKLLYFTDGNTGIVYNIIRDYEFNECNTIVNKSMSVHYLKSMSVHYQPIFKARLACLAIKLNQLADNLLPSDVMFHVAEHVELHRKSAI